MPPSGTDSLANPYLAKYIARSQLWGQLLIPLVLKPSSSLMQSSNAQTDTSSRPTRDLTSEDVNRPGPERNDTTLCASTLQDLLLRSSRLVEEVERALVLYAQCAFSNGVHLSLPHLVDVCIMPPIMDMFLICHPDTEVFDLVYLSLDDLLTRWMLDARAQLIQELTASVLPEPGSTTLVAFTLLRCNICRAVRTFSSAFFHRCSNQPYSRMQEDGVLSSNISIFKHLIQSDINRCAWDARNFRPRPDSLCRIQNIITAVNAGNIQTATSIEFDELDPRLVCELCIMTTGEKLAMPWRSALFHCLHAHHDTSARDVTWISLRKEDVAVYENATYQSAISSLKYELESKWACAICDPYDRIDDPDSEDESDLYGVDLSDKPQVITHLSRHHDISQPVLSQNFYRVTDSDPYIVYPYYVE